MNKVYNKELDRHVSIGPDKETVVIVVGDATWSLSGQSAAATPFTARLTAGCFRSPQPQRRAGSAVISHLSKPLG